MIFVIDDDVHMAKCIERAVLRAGREVRIFSNAIEAMNLISDGVLPEMILLDILLDGPDGFTFLNELISYSDTARIPVVIVTSLDLSGRDLRDYGVVKILAKDTMKPSDIVTGVLEYTGV